MGLSDIFIYKGSIPIELILWSFYIAIVIGTVIMYLTKAKFGKLIHSLLENDACSPEKARTLDEIGIKPSLFIKLGLKNHLNYKDLLVAITEDGKYYANTVYTDEPPKLKTLVAITRKKRSRITESAKAEETEAVTETQTLDSDNSVSSGTVTELISETSDAVASVNAEAQSDAQTQKPERVKFDVMSARYYIPEEIHAKVRTLYKDSSIKLRWVIPTLIALGIITYFSGFITEELIRMLQTFKSK